MEDIVFPKRYRSKLTGRVFLFTSFKEGTVVHPGDDVRSIGYRYDGFIDCTDTSVWEPVEEEHTVSEKEPFPAFEDIEWVMVEAPKGVTSINGMTLLEEKLYCSNGAYRAEVEVARIIHENLKDFKVTWKLKEKPVFKVEEWYEFPNGAMFQYGKGRLPEDSTMWNKAKPINRKLHENRALAVAVGKWLVEHSEAIEIKSWHLCGIMTSAKNGELFILRDKFGIYESVDLVSLPDDLDLTPFIEQYRIELEKVRRNG